jgi:hypothetical protein
MTVHDSKKVFQEILSTTDRTQIISQAVAQNVDFSVRLNPTTEFKTKALKLVSPKQVEFKPPENLKLSLQQVIVQFDDKQERYYAKADLAFDDWKVFFIFSGALFRLHRRQYQRLKIPAHFKNRILLLNVNDEVWNEECDIHDLSLGGCSLTLTYRNLDIPIGAIVMLELKIGDYRPFFQIGQICYKHLDKIEGKSKLKVGIQFRPLPKYSLHLQSVVQGLALDIFSSWSQKK